ncbi:MAG: hypothetical protein VYB05_07745 [Pseudomonadota bacterium]|nr:hypothetical protein [Pseudomonadota bacterium]
MALILGLDIATTTGFAWYDTDASLSAVRPGSFKIEGECYEARAGEMGQSIIKMVKQTRPDFVVIERPARNVMQHRKKTNDFAGEHEEMTINAGTALLLNQLTGAASAIVRAYQIPFEIVAPETWRKQFLGFGRRPGWSRKDWKKAARDRCRQLRITVTNDDQADAVGLAFAGPSCQTFKIVQARRTGAAA